MFRETTVHKWDIVTIHSRLLYTIPARWTLAIAFIGLLVTTSNVTSFFVPLSVKLSGLSPSWKILHCNLPVIDLSNKFVERKCFGDGLCLMDVFRLNCFIRFRQVNGNNRWHKFHGSTVWPDFTFWRMAFLMVPPTSSIVEPGQWLFQEHCSC